MMDSAEEYGFKSDYDEYDEIQTETAVGGKKQPAPVPGTAKIVKKKKEVLV